MAWRKFEDHNSETKAVKAALAARGITADVGHGRGTAWGWLEIWVGPNPYEHLCRRHNGAQSLDGCLTDDCLACKWYQAIPEQAGIIAREITGRSGPYGGEINVFTQIKWRKSHGK